MYLVLGMIAFAQISTSLIWNNWNLFFINEAWNLNYAFQEKANMSQALKCSRSLQELWKRQNNDINNACTPF